MCHGIVRVGKAAQNYIVHFPPENSQVSNYSNYYFPPQTFTTFLSL